MYGFGVYALILFSSRLEKPVCCMAKDLKAFWENNPPPPAEDRSGEVGQCCIL